MAAKTTPTKSTKDAADTAAARAIAPSPEWNRAMPPGPEARVKFETDTAADDHNHLITPEEKFMVAMARQ